MDVISSTIGSLSIPSSGTKKTCLTVFATRPPQQYARLGKLCGIFEIESNDPAVVDLCDALAAESQRWYYHPSAEKISTEELEQHFENALQKINQFIVEFVEEHRVSLPIERMHCTIIASLQEKVFMAPVGNVTILMLQALANGNLRALNILELSKTPTTPPNPFKIFSQVLYGTMHPGDVIVATTPMVLDYFSIEKIKYIFAQHHPVTQAIRELEQQLQQLNVRNGFGALAIETQKTALYNPVSQATVMTPATPPRQTSETIAAHKSMHELVHTQKNTEKMLAPSLIPEIKKAAGAIVAMAHHLRTMIRVPRWPRRILQKNQRSGFSAAAQRKAVTVFSMPSKYVNHIKKWFLGMPIKIKLLFLVVVACIGLFFVSTTIQKNHKAQQAQIAVIDTEIAAINAAVTESEASLIYRDERAARQTLLDATTKLTAVKPLTDTQRETIAGIQATIQQQLARLRNEFSVEPITILSGEHHILGSTAKAVISYSSAEQRIAIIDRTTQAITTVSSTLPEFKHSVVVNDQEALLVLPDNSLVAVALKNGSTQSLTINFSPTPTIDAINIYNNRLYIIDRQRNALYRLTRAGQAYGAAYSWVRDSTVNLASAQALTIDANIYIATSAGQVIKLTGGVQQAFSLDAIDPALTSVRSIHTDTAWENIYITDTTNRLLVFDKRGALIAQYTAPQLEGLKYAAVDPGNNKVFAQTNAGIVFFTAPQ